MLNCSVWTLGPCAINNELFSEICPRLKCGFAPDPENSRLSARRVVVNAVYLSRFDKFGAICRMFFLHLENFCQIV